MSITLRELLHAPQIATEVIAGASGLDRPVIWAHSCEMPQPWDWLGPDELLMTIGVCIPKLAAGQVEFVRRLAESGLAGMAIGDDLPSRRPTKSMLKAADDLGFPILVTDHAVPFSVIARAVASANHDEQLARLTRLSRLSTALSGRADQDGPMLAHITAELGHVIHVVDVRHGTEIMTAPHKMNPLVGEAITARSGDHAERLPARLHIDLGEESVTCFPIRSSRRPAMLVVPDAAGHRIDPFAVLHVTNLIAVELERLSAIHEIRRRRASDLLRQLIDGRLDRQSAAERLQQFNLPDNDLAAVAVTEGDDVPRNLLFDRRFPHLMTEDSTGVIALISVARISELISMLPDSTAVGTSDVIRSLTRVGDAVREARWALETARSQGGGQVDYAGARPLFLPRTVAEAINATRTVLGPLLDYDSTNGTELVRSLEVYLACDRSWNQAAKVLRIHRQTLGYRLTQVERLTGRQLRRTGDIAELWLAVLARRSVSDPLGHVDGRAD